MSKETKFISAMLHSNYHSDKIDRKVCTKCGENKAMKEFSKNEKCTDGRRQECKKCMSKRASERYHAKKKERDIYSEFMPI